VWRPAPPPKRSRVLNAKLDRGRADEVRWFWDACGDLGEPFGPLLKLLLMSGCRLNEIAQLRWTELNDDRSMISLPGTRTKNGLPHDIALPPMARDILREVKRIERCS